MTKLLSDTLKMSAIGKKLIVFVDGLTKSHRTQNLTNIFEHGFQSQDVDAELDNLDPYELTNFCMSTNTGIVILNDIGRSDQSSTQEINALFERCQFEESKIAILIIGSNPVSRSVLLSGDPGFVFVHGKSRSKELAQEMGGMKTTSKCKHLNLIYDVSCCLIDCFLLQFDLKFQD